MAERVTDLRDIERRVTARLVGRARARRAHAARALGARRRGPGARRHRRPGPRRSCSRWSPSAAAPPATPRSSPASSASPAWSAPPASMAIAGGTPAARRRHRRHGRDRPGRGARRASGCAPTARPARRSRRWSRTRPRPPTGPASRSSRTSPTASRRARPPAAPVEGVGLFRTELCFLNRKDEPSVEEQAAIYAEVLARLRRREVRRGPHPRRRARTSRSPSRRSRARRTPPSASAGCGCRSATRPCSSVSSTASRPRPRQTGTETWVMAPMVATVAEAAEFAEQVRARGLKAGVMVEVPSAALLAHRMLEVVDFLSIGTNDLTQYTMAADRMATDLAHLTDPWQPAVLQLIAITAEAGTPGRQAGRGLRRGRGRPAAGLRPGRHGHHVAVDGRRPRCGRSAPGSRPSPWTSARTPPRRRSPPRTRWPPARPCSRPR